MVFSLLDVLNDYYTILSRFERRVKWLNCSKN